MSSWRSSEKTEDPRITKLYTNLSRLRDEFYKTRTNGEIYRFIKRIESIYPLFKSDMNAIGDIDIVIRNKLFDDFYSLFTRGYSEWNRDFSRVISNISRLKTAYNEKLDVGIERDLKPDTPQIIKDYYLHTRKDIRVDHCSCKILFWTIHNGEMAFLMGNDEKYGEWTPFGGTCNGDYQRLKSCRQLAQENRIYSCLQTEVYEESKELIKSVPSDCKYIDYTIPYRLKRYNTNLYMAMINGDVSGLVSEFEKRGDDYKSQLEKSGKDAKSFMEMKSIRLLSIDDFKGMMRKSLAHYNSQEFRNYFSDATFLHHGDEVVKNLTRQTNDTQGDRLDIFIFIGLVDFVNRHHTYTTTDEIVDYLVIYLRQHSTCSHNL